MPKKDEKTHRVPINIYFEPELLAEVEEAWHEARCRNRSEWITNAIREQLKREGKKK